MKRFVTVSLGILAFCFCSFAISSASAARSFGFPMGTSWRPTLSESSPCAEVLWVVDRPVGASTSVASGQDASILSMKEIREPLRPVADRNVFNGCLQQMYFDVAGTSGRSFGASEGQTSDSIGRGALWMRTPRATMRGTIVSWDFLSRWNNDPVRRGSSPRIVTRGRGNDVHSHLRESHRCWITSSYARNTGSSSRISHMRRELHGNRIPQSHDEVILQGVDALSQCLMAAEQGVAAAKGLEEGPRRRFLFGTMLFEDAWGRVEVRLTARRGR